MRIAALCQLFAEVVSSLLTVRFLPAFLKSRPMNFVVIQGSAKEWIYLLMWLEFRG